MSSRNTILSAAVSSTVKTKARADKKRYQRRSDCFKTLAIFEGITKKKLLLKEHEGTPYTDGREIGISFDRESYYQDLEHEIAHILFESDPIAIKLFVDEYSSRVSKVLGKQGVALSEGELNALKQGLKFLINITEDHRINSLWGLLYKGSYKIIREQDRETTRDKVVCAHMGISILYAVIETGWDPGEGELDRFIPFMQETLEKVNRRGFEATLIMAKWLVSKMVSELVEEARKNGRNKSKAQAFKQFIGMLSDLPGDLIEKFSDLKDPDLKPRGSASAAAEIVSKALRLNIQDEKELSNALDEASKKAAQKLEEASKALESNGKSRVDGWLRKDMGARVVLLDVTKKDIDKDTPPFTPEDIRAVNRLRGVFNRVMGRRRFSLEDEGNSLDVSAYIERIVTKHPVPVFQQSSPGKGFKALILMDRSGSMSGIKKTQSERACRILLRALDYPFVSLHIWGWNARASGQLDICRFDPKLECFDSPKSRVTGSTPLHLAVRFGSRFMEMGDEYKFMLVTTDGQPTACAADGKGYYSFGSLYRWTREEVQKARKKGTSVTGVIIGNEVSDDQMSQMFAPRHWRRLGEDTLGADLVRVTADGFINYLRRG